MEDAFYIKVYWNIQVKIELVFKIHNLHLYPSSLPLPSYLSPSPLSPSLSSYLYSHRGHKGTIWSLVTSGDCLFSGSSDGTIKVWDIADLRRGCLKTVQGHKEAVRERERERERN